MNIDIECADLLKNWIKKYRNKKNNLWNQTEVGKLIKNFVQDRGNWKGKDKIKLKEVVKKKVIEESKHNSQGY